MSSLSIQTPVPGIPVHGSAGHAVQLYSEDSFLLEVLSRFVGDAWAVGNTALVIATASHRMQLEKSLAARGLVPSQAAAQGRYLALDANETLAHFMINGSLDEERFLTTIGGILAGVQKAQANEDCRLAVFGEMVALLWAQGQAQEAVRLEQLWNELAKKYSFSLLCAYPVGSFDHENHLEPFLKMCGQHSSVAPSESYLGLSSEEERLRNVAQLQQRTQILEKQLAARHSEQQFRLLVEAVQDYAIFMLDPNGNIASWNPGAERIKQYKGSEIIGKHFSCFYPEEDIRDGKPERELVTAAGEGTYEEEGWRLRKDGSKFWAHVTLTAIRDEGKLIGFAKVTRDFTERMQTQRALQKEVAERREAQAQLHRSEKSLRQLSLHLLRTQDEERKRIGRDLHDSLGQYLAVLKMKLESLAPSLGQSMAGSEGTRDESQAEAATQDLIQCIRLAEDCIKEVRTVSYLLYPPMLEEMGLKSAILWYLDGFSARSGISTTFEVQTGFDRLPRESELALFRVLQESLTNVHRHSGSATAHVRLSMKEGFGILEVEDKGKGISPQLLEQSGEDWMGALGVGLRGMNERMRQLGGRIELVSNASGTAVSAIVPAAPSLA